MRHLRTLPLLWLLGALVSVCMPVGVVLAAHPPPPATAFFMDVCWGGFACLTNAQVTVNLINAAFVSISFLAVTIFLVGALLWVLSAGNDTLIQRGKGMMELSLIGLALVVGSYGIYRTIVFILYSG